MEQKFVRRVRHEVDIYNHLGRSLNIAYLYGAYEDDFCIDLVMELCTGGNLWTHIRNEDYSEAAAARIIRDILLTVAQCHAKGVVMRDVKPENFLFSHDGPDACLKAVDFGIAAYCSEDGVLTDRAGTPIYVAPEVLKMKYGQKADVWSVGIIAYQLLTGRLPFMADGSMLASSLTLTNRPFSNKEVFRAILYGDLVFEGAPWDERSQEAKEFVSSLLQRDPAQRVTAQQALQSAWLRRAGSADVAAAVPLDSSLVQRLQRFGTYGKFKQVALSAISKTLSANIDIITELQAAFDAMDDDGDGLVDVQQLVRALSAGAADSTLRFDVSETEARQLLAGMDVDEDGLISRNEWIAALMDWRVIQEDDDWAGLVRQAFTLFDVNGSGKIEFSDLQHLLCGGEACFIPDTIDAVLREADMDQDGGINLDEFKRLLLTSQQDRLEFYASRLMDIKNPLRV